jgi:hypothetical protein
MGLDASPTHAQVAAMVIISAGVLRVPLGTFQLLDVALTVSLFVPPDLWVNTFAVVALNFHFRSVNADK